MKSNRRAQTTSRDNHQVWFIRQGASKPGAVCAQCDERIQMITLLEAAAAAGVESQVIHTLIKAGKLHCLVTDEAVLLVCLNSLLKLGLN